MDSWFLNDTRNRGFRCDIAGTRRSSRDSENFPLRNGNSIHSFCNHYVCYVYNRTRRKQTNYVFIRIFVCIFFVQMKWTLVLVFPRLDCLLHLSVIWLPTWSVQTAKCSQWNEFHVTSTVQWVKVIRDAIIYSIRKPCATISGADEAPWVTSDTLAMFSQRLQCCVDHF